MTRTQKLKNYCWNHLEKVRIRAEFNVQHSQNEIGKRFLKNEI